MPRGSSIYTVELNGQRLRISAPSNASDSELESLANAEVNRQQGFKDLQSKTAKAVQPVNRSLGERFGSAFQEGLYNSPLADEKAQGQVVPPNIGPGLPNDRGPVLVNPKGGEPQFSGPSMEDIPVVGPLVGMGRAVLSGQFPEALGGLASGVLTAPPGLPATRTSLGNAFKRGAAEAKASPTSIYSHPISALLGAKAANMAGIPWYEGAFAGSAIGGKTLPFLRGFGKGLQEPVTTSAPIENVAAEPPAQTPAQVAGVLAPQSQQLPAASSIQMGPAHMVDPYASNQSVVRSPFTGTYMKRQMPLNLYQEGANIPGGSYQGPPPPKFESESGGIKSEDLKKMGQNKPALQMSKVGKASPEEIQKVADTLGISVDELKQKFPHLAAGEGDVPEYEYRGKGQVKVEEKTEPKGIITPKAVRAQAEAEGKSPQEIADQLKQEGYTIKNDPWLKTMRKKGKQ